MLVKTGVDIELFHTPAGTAFADLLIDGRRETWPIRSKHFRHWLRRCCYEATGMASVPSIGSVLDLLEAKAQFDAPERTVHIRVAEHAGHIYLDLADQHWRAVDIGPDGWRVMVCPPVRFRRPAGLLPLSLPQQGGSLEALASFLNLAHRDDLVLIVAWLLATLRSNGPYPLLAISGEQGSAKTVSSKLLKSLLDSHVAPVRAIPREQRDLMIAANNGHVLAFDNVSSLPHWLSDALCRLASGGSFAARKLFTDEDEVLFQATRPIILNGIEDVISRADLADRAIFLKLTAIDAGHRRPEAELCREFERARPLMLGALLDAAAHGLRTLPDVRLSKLPRMADFALWASACETAFWPTGTFARAYGRNRQAAIETVLDNDPVATGVQHLMAERTIWTGTAAQLLQTCSRLIGGDRLRGAHWPKTPRAIASRLRRAQTFLRALGIDVSFYRVGRVGSRIIQIRRHADRIVSTDTITGPVMK